MKDFVHILFVLFLSLTTINCQLRSDALKIKGYETSFNVEFGFVLDPVMLDRYEDFTSGLDSTGSASLGFNLNLYYVIIPKYKEQFRFEIGIGSGYDIMSLKPILPIHDLGFSNSENIYVTEIFFEQLNLRFPIKFNYITPEVGELQFFISVGIDQSVTLLRRRHFAHFIRNYSSGDINNEFYEGEELGSLVSKNLSNSMKNYELGVNVSFGIFNVAPGVFLGYQFIYIVRDQFPNSLTLKDKLAFGVFVKGRILDIY